MQIVHNTGADNFKSGSSDFRKPQPFAAPGTLPELSAPPAQGPELKWSQPFPVKQGSVASAQELEQRRCQQRREHQAQQAERRIGEVVGRMQKLENSDDNLSAGLSGRVTVMNSTGGVGLLARLFGETPSLNGELTYDPASREVRDFRGQLYDKEMLGGRPQSLEYHRRSTPQGEVECFREGSLEYRVNRLQGTLSMVEYPR
ncbi:MAG: hypothetical protein KF760_30830 [Candidatus Eremiobacteraeota bacterium]|nr:hypothetical protein [Candidatus Eremiobacteraeota bacterium]MCW5871236.1 hypothetical protein [Candidatus Eremiobacteraeota bacterium]